MLARFFALPFREQVALVEAVLCLGLARLLLIVPFKRVAPYLGRAEAGAAASEDVLDAERRETAIVIRRGILRVSKRLPWHSSCLVCAIAGLMMLHRRRMPSVLHLGARVDAQTDLAAHAWLRCGEVDVVGAEIAEQYTPIAAFKA